MKKMDLKRLRKAASALRSLYDKSPWIYSFAEVVIVLGVYFSILWIFRFCVFGLYYSILSGFICLIVFTLGFFVHRDDLKLLGIRVDNVLKSSKECIIAALVSIGAILILWSFYDQDFSPRRLVPLLTGFLIYVGGGIFQQFFLNSFLLLRIKEISRSNIIALPITALLFSLMHAPHWEMMLLTLGFALVFCFLFLRNRNIFTLGITHAVLAVAFLFFLVPGFVRRFEVGPPGGESYDTYGNGAEVAAGDVNGDGRDELLIGRGPGPDNDTEILVCNEDGDVINRIRAFDAGVFYGVNIAAGDINGDGKDEIIAAKGPHYRNDTEVRVLGSEGREILHFTAFEGKKFGTNIAAGDINGDGLDEIITAPGPGQGYMPIIRIFNAKGEKIYEYKSTDFIQDGSYYKKIRHGLQVGSGDIDGDGRDEILLGLAHIIAVRAYVSNLDFDAVNGAFIQYPWFPAFPSGKRYRYGVNLSAGDINGDGFDEIITGPGPSEFSPDDLRVFDSKHELIFEAFPFGLKYGLNVASGDVNGDGLDEIIVGPGPGEKYGTDIKIIYPKENKDKAITAVF